MLLRRPGRRNRRIRGEVTTIVLVVVCTLRADHLTAYGHPQPTTTFLGRLAARGATFEQVQSTSSWTAPSTASIFTSLYPHQHGVVRGLVNTLKAGARMNELNRIPAPVMTLVEGLQESGFLTIGVADNPNVTDELGFGQGFDSFTTFGYRGAGAVTAQLLSCEAEIRAAPRRFIFLGFIDPHQPLHVWPGWEGPPGPPAEKTRRPGQFTASRIRGVPALDPTKASREAIVAAYDGEIAHMDQVLAGLYRRFGWEDALLVVVGDHGEELWERGSFGHGTTLHGEVTQVPLIVHGPGIPPRTIRTGVSTLDLLPTIRELAGLSPQRGVQGRSLVPLLRGASTLPHAAMAELDRKEGHSIRSVVEGRWKLLWSARPAGGGAALLYDLERDPGETTDRSREQQQRAAALDKERRRLEALPSMAAAPTGITLDEKQRETLESLGYVE